jgi:hypothetical protein
MVCACGVELAEGGKAVMFYGPENPPTSIEEAQERRRHCIAEAVEIQRQLGSSRSALSRGAGPLAHRSYEEAKEAWHDRRQESIYLKEWLAAQRAPQNRRVPGRLQSDVHSILKAHKQAETAGISADTLSALSALYAICVRMMLDGVVLTKAERMAVSVACHVLRIHDMEPPRPDTAQEDS